MGTPPFQETESPEGELAGSFLVYCLCVAKVRNGSGGSAVALKEPTQPVEKANLDPEARVSSSPGGLLSIHAQLFAPLFFWRHYPFCFDLLPTT